MVFVNALKCPVPQALGGKKELSPYPAIPLSQGILEPYWIDTGNIVQGRSFFQVKNGIDGLGIRKIVTPYLFETNRNSSMEISFRLLPQLRTTTMSIYSA